MFVFSYDVTHFLSFLDVSLGGKATDLDALIRETEEEIENASAILYNLSKGTFFVFFFK